ncbi:formimidoylglutamate deiminase [Plantibacter sp. YIM 135347]|uniref:formimidoylglutamate deiminase n=1 Tax=Plantibacter sp. YIM 135347 TaxID=3423919 RepID=UPI003D32ABE6
MSGAAVWAHRVWIGRSIANDVRIAVAEDGTIASVTAGVAAEPGDTVLHGVVYPSGVNAHSHAFHRLLRGRTHGDGGSFWTWRELMYEEAARLEPVSYERVATAVYAEMVAAGWTSVAEFHYVHHRTDGTPYGKPGASTHGGEPAAREHAMERALANAAVASGIRLTLLDTAYLAGGFGTSLSAEQQRFGDESMEAWLRRGRRLRDAFAEEYDPRFVTVGAALHSVRAVPAADLAIVAAELHPDIPLHVHLSEQPAENEACLAATGLTPTELLAANGLLGPRLSAVHATHLSEHDIELLGGAGATIVMCPTTEADLGDGIGPARALADAGATIALGTDQHAVVDPLLEMRALEHGERLGSGRRGRFSPAELVAAVSTGGAASVGRTGIGSLAVGSPCDLIELDPASSRTMGGDPAQLALTATASDVRTVVIGGRVMARNGVHAELGAPAELLASGMELL